jgi:hypothetical protein
VSTRLGEAAGGRGRHAGDVHVSAERDRPKPGAYRPYVAARRPGGRPDAAPQWRVLVHRRYLSVWESLVDRVGLANAQQFWDHVAYTPDRPPRVGRSSVMKGKHKKGGDGWSPVIHYEISGAGRIDYQYNPAYQTSSSADEHAVVRMLVIDLGSH